MENIFSNKNILYIFSKWWKHLVIVTIIGTVVIGASTYLIKPKYKSFAVVYPENLGAFSEESYTEQMVQVLNSRDIAWEVIKGHELDKHWGISKDDKIYQSKIYEYYFDFVSIRKTPYESVEISVLDTNPELACALVNSILKHYNEKVRTIHRQKILELIEVNKRQIINFDEKAELSKNLLENIIKKSGNKDLAKIIDLGKGDSKLDNKLESLDNRAKNAYKSRNIVLQSKSSDLDIDNVKNYGTEFLHYFRIYREEIAAIADLKIEVEQQLIEAEKEITYYAMISSPYAPDKKFSPMRVPIALIGGLSALLIGFFILGVIERKS